MPKDAKFGLVVGISLVIVIAVVFYRKEAAPGGAAAAVSAAGPSPVAAPRGQYRPVRAKPTQWPDGAERKEPRP